MKTLISTNPAKNYEKVGEINISSQKDVDQAILNSKKAYSKWKNLSVEQRSSYFEKLIQVYEKKGEEVAKLQTLEVGKPIKQSREDVQFDINNIKSKIKMASSALAPQTLDQTDKQKNVLYYEPYGVVAVIVPWNFPSSNVFISILQVLLAGNTVVLKHSEECPLTSKLLKEIFDEAGFPEGVFEVVYGAGDVGDILTDGDINMIHFTGSTKTGRYLYEKAGKKFIPAVLEMGGSSPGIVLPDADLISSCENICFERFNNCGQICCALKRLIVHKDIFDDVVNKLKKEINLLKVGDPLDENTDVGPLVAKRQLDVLVDQVNDAKEKGAEFILGGNVFSDLPGAYFEPSLVTNVNMDMKLMTEEVFGPILPIVTFETIEEAIQIANNTPYGLSAFVYGKDVDQISEIAKKIDAGVISLNGASYFSENSPFGGYKLSGMGRNDGFLGFHEACQKKVIAEPV